MSIVETEVHDLRNKLAKQLVADPASQETIQDLIAALGKVPMKLDLLRTSKVGVTVQEVKKLYAGEKLGSEAKQLLNKWRKEVSGGEDSDKKGKDTSSQKGHTNSSDVGQDSAAATPSVDEEDDSMYKDLTDTRLMVHRSSS